MYFRGLTIKSHSSGYEISPITGFELLVTSLPSYLKCGNKREIRIVNMAGICKRKRALAVLMLFDLEEKKPSRRKRNRTLWTRSWIEKREIYGCYQRLVKELEIEDEVAYRDFFRMNATRLWFLVDKVACRIEKKDTVMRTCIKPDERMAVTLRYLATGETFKSFEYSFRMSRTISAIVVETCEAIYQVVGKTHLKTLSTENDWLSVAKRFESCFTSSMVLLFFSAMAASFYCLFALFVYSASWLSQIPGLFFKSVMT